MLEEFKNFALRGNVMDMAIGIIIGAAFGVIIKSLVDNILMPVVGLLTGGVDFSNMFITLKGESFATLEAAREAGAVTINYGLFLNAIIAFLIVAWCMFMIVRTMNMWAKEQEKEEEKAPDPLPSREEILLAEIRDLLKKP